MEINEEKIILETKNHIIVLVPEYFSLILLKINLYSDNSIEFIIYIINRKETDIYKGNYTYEKILQEFNLGENKFFYDANDIFDFFCELIENNEDSAIFNDVDKILKIKNINKEFKFELNDKIKIFEEDTLKILFNEISRNININNIIN